MMKLFRNAEIRYQFYIEFFLAAIFTVTGFLCSKVCGVLVLLTALALMLAQGIANYARYEKIARLSHCIDRILHGDDRLKMIDYQEGELSILTSEIYKMTVSLRDASDKLQQDKQWLLDTMADISHQLRTPLTAINLTVSMLAEEDLTPERHRELVHRLRSLHTRMDWLVEGLLKLSKIDAGVVPFQQENVSLDALVRQAAEPLTILMDVRGQSLVLDIGQLEVQTDRYWTTEAISNILKNCIEHTPENGTVTVRAERTAIFTKLVISDTGTGFAPEDLPHLFERFYKGKNAADGSVGIGLALCRSILQAQNASVKAGNGKTGAEFTIKFYETTV